MKHCPYDGGLMLEGEDYYYTCWGPEFYGTATTWQCANCPHTVWINSDGKIMNDECHCGPCKEEGKLRGLRYQ